MCLSLPACISHCLACKLSALEPCRRCISRDTSWHDIERKSHKPYKYHNSFILQFQPETLVLYALRLSALETGRVGALLKPHSPYKYSVTKLIDTIQLLSDVTSDSSPSASSTLPYLLPQPPQPVPYEPLPHLQSLPSAFPPLPPFLSPAPPLLSPFPSSQFCSDEPETLVASTSSLSSTSLPPSLSLPANTPPQTTSSLLYTLNANIPTAQSTTDILPLLDVLANLVQSLVTAARESGANRQTVAEVTAIKNQIDNLLHIPLPKEITKSSAIFILDPIKLRVRDCNETFLQIFGTPETKHKILTTNVKMAYKPFVRQLVLRDLAYFTSNGVTQATRYYMIPYGDEVIYALGHFHVLAPNYSVVTLITLLEEMPRCLQITYRHFLGLSNNGPEPPHECAIEHCHCKMLHYPLPPV